MKKIYIIPLILVFTAGGLFVKGLCLSAGDKRRASQPDVAGRRKELISESGLQFKDLNGGGKLDPYEDWRLPVEKRVEDLLNQMTLEEKAGMLLIDTLNAARGGQIPEKALWFIQKEHMTRFVFRNPVSGEQSSDPNGWRGEVTPFEAARFMNGIQEIAEATRLGIPVLFKSNARNHYTLDARAFINVEAGSFSQWPKEAGLAATRDLDLIKEFAETMASEWSAIGLRGMYGYMADLATEPRWYRIHESFTEDADLAAEIMTVLVENIQGKEIGPGSVVLTMKHFPGGGPQEGGADPHYPFGKNQIYPADNFDYHVKPFKAAIDAGLIAIMPYYGIPVEQKYQPNDVGMAFSKGIISGLLRDELGFDGVVNSDTGIIGSRAWGLENLSLEEQVVVAINAGTDVLSGFNSNKLIRDLVLSGKISEDRLDESVRRLLIVQFKLGLFENPYVDPQRADSLVGNRRFLELGLEAQKKSVVLLENSQNVLPLPAPADDKPVKLFTIGMNSEVTGDPRWGGYTIVTGETSSFIPEDTDYALIRVNVDNRGADRNLFFGGANPDELNNLSFTDMDHSVSWNINPPLNVIKAIMNETGAEKTILSIYFRQPYVLDKTSGIGEAGALLATFGVSDAALMDVLTGGHAPSGKLPFALANSGEAILRQDSDTPGYDVEDTLYPFGHGLTY